MMMSDFGLVSGLASGCSNPWWNRSYLLERQNFEIFMTGEQSMKGKANVMKKT
jgi:hypothetical protein